MNVGVLGGTFDPPHRGHLHAAREAQRAFDLGRILFVPCSRQPLKAGRPSASGFHRAAMVALAVSGRPDWALETIELERGGASYTAETLAALRAAGTGDRFFLILGEDSFRTLQDWHRWKDIVAETSLIVVPRPGSGDGLPARGPAGARVRWVQAPPLRASSSEVRARLSAGHSVRALVPAAVAAYIVRQGLYGAGSEPGPRGR